MDLQWFGNVSSAPLHSAKNRRFTKTGSGQTQEKLSKKGGVSAAGDKWRSHKLIKRLADSDAGAKHASFCAVM
jgi:hypothetical protein